MIQKDFIMIRRYLWRPPSNVFWAVLKSRGLATASILMVIGLLAWLLANDNGMLFY